MFCENCGKELEENVRFCINCGAEQNLTNKHKAKMQGAKDKRLRVKQQTKPQDKKKLFGILGSVV